MTRAKEMRLLCVVLLAGACFACSASAPLPPIAEAPPPPPALMMSCNKSVFLNKILFETTPVDPTPGSTPPTSGATFPAGPDYKGDLGTAFDAASDQFQAQLCGLDVIYVQNGNSWGWQQKNKVTVGNGRLVAVSTSLWNGPQTYTQYETDRLQSVLPTDGRYTSANIDDGATRLLAVLAHEVGHIRWNDPALIDQAHPGSFCNGIFFRSWKMPVHQQPQWRHLLSRGERDNQRGHGHWRDAHKRNPHIDTIDSEDDNGSDPAQLIADLFAPTQPWASGLAANSPDEDFVETYRFKVLTTARTPLTSVIGSFPRTNPGSQNIPVDYFAGVNGTNTRKADLVGKVNCIPNTL
jgi:hypothetical protein